MRKRRKISAEIDRGAPAFLVIERFGGLTKFCDMCRYPTSTAYDWLKKGLIPADHQAHILTIARQHRVRIQPADFVPVPVNA